MTRSTSSGAGFTNGSSNETDNNGHASDNVDNMTSVPPTTTSQPTGLVKARTMSYTQKLIENGDNGNSDDCNSASRRLSASKANIKELTNKQRNWFSSFEKSRTPSITSTSHQEPIDSVRRTSVKNDHTPTQLSGNSTAAPAGPAPPPVTPPPPPPKSLPPDATPTPPSSLNLPRDRRPLSARGSNDSIEDYLRNWKKNENGTSPLPSPGIESIKSTNSSNVESIKSTDSPAGM